MRLKQWTGLALSLMLSPAAMAATEFYLLRTADKPLGQVEIERYDMADGNRVTEVRNINRLKRDGEPFDISAISRFVEASADGAPIGFSYRYHMAAQSVMEAEGMVDGDALRLALQGRDGLKTATVPIDAKRFVFPGGSRVENIYQSHFTDSEGSRFRYQTLHLAGEPRLVNTEVTLSESGEAISAENTPLLRRFAVRNADDPAASGTVYEWRGTDV